MWCVCWRILAGWRGVRGASLVRLMLQGQEVEEMRGKMKLSESVFFSITELENVPQTG